jgi:PKD repeat protein
MSTNSGEAPLTVDFTNTTTGTATEYTWNFGDNSNIVTNVNPSHTFTEVGTYNVILEALGPGGQTSTFSHVTVNNAQVPAPVANFETSTQSGPVPLTLQLTNTSSGTVDTYLWDFDGDNITDSIEANPTIQINNPGDVNIRLIAIGPGGQDETTQTITAVNPPDAPVAGFTVSTQTGNAPLTVNFTNTTTGDATGYAWDFNGDDVTDSTDTNPSFSFNDVGTYNVKLTATGVGGSTTAIETITVTAPLAPPVANFDASTLIGESPLSVTFANTSVGSELQFAWDFNTDGVIDSTENSPTYEFTIAGSYTVTLTVSNAVGTDTATATINVSDAVAQQPPTAAFSANPPSGPAPLPITFTNLSIGDITSYEWDFQNDGIIDSTEESPTVNFDVAGDYTVKLRAVGPSGSSEITSIVSVANALVAPVAGFKALPTDLSVS